MIAQKIIDTDRLIDIDEQEIDKLYLLLLAKRQPLTTDLRVIALVLKMIAGIERIGDLTIIICEKILRKINLLK